MLAAAMGKIPGLSSVNKFGRAPSGIQTTITDIWDRADATPTQQIWVAPTQARTHQITSSSASDDGDPVGVGAQTLRISGLTDWDTKEVTEDITLNGVSNVPTANQYVIIHRMRVLNKGATNVNVGTITATADTDASITAAILPGQGQTQMAIYGIPSKQKAYVTQYYASYNKSGGAAGAVDMSFLSNDTPDSELLKFRVQHTKGVQSTGSSDIPHQFLPYLECVGPCILKMQGVGSAADQDVSAGFDIILADN